MRKIFLLITLFLYIIAGPSYAQSGNALDFDGINDYVEVPDPQYFYLSNSYTIECWIKPKAFSALAGIVSKKNTDASQGFTLRLSDTAPYTGINFDGMTTANGILSADTWYHIAAVNDNGIRYLYVNGVQQNLSGTSTNYNAYNTDRITLGADNISGIPKYFKGALETVRVDLYALSESTVRIRMNDAEFWGNNTLINFQFNQGIAYGNNSSETTLINRKSGSTNGTLMNFALSGETSNWIGVTGWVPATYYLYVNPTASGNGDGGSWQNAFNSLVQGLNNAYPGAIVWVTKGVYKPTNGTDRNVTLIVKNNVRLYGGFAGNETSLDQRNWQLNETILSGNIGDLNTDADNSFSVLRVRGAAVGTIISGFTIRDGNAPEGIVGGGLIIEGDVTSSKSSPTIEYCKIIRNKSSIDGGGIRIASTNEGHLNLNINQCLIANNSAFSGAAIYFEQTSNNASFQNNLTITSCTIAHNTCTKPNSSGALDIYVSSKQKFLTISIINTIIWGNNIDAYYLARSNQILSISYSDIQGKGTSDNNIDTNPYFSNPDNDDFSISNGCSPVINAGTNNVPFVYDLNHNPRIKAGMQIIDMGAYEYFGSGSAGRFYLKPAIAGNGKGYDWNNAMHTFPANKEGCTVAEVWVAAGTYKPTADNDRNKSFTPLSGVKYYGGFVGNESTLGQRNWAINKTILSGNIGNLNDSLDNSSTVVRLSNVNGTLLDGLIIQDANGAGNGGGIRIDNSFNGRANSAFIVNCIITKNNVVNSGGGICNLAMYYPSDITILNTAIYGNSARQGGAIGNLVTGASASFKLVNCTIAQNTATVAGGAIYNFSSSSSVLALDSIFNSIIWGNIAPIFPGIANDQAGAKSDAFSSDIQDLTPDEARNVISTNPWFMNPAKRDYTPSTCGRSVNTGNNGYLLNNYLSFVSKDILGNIRIRGNIDMGAYEYAGSVKYSNEYPRLYVNKNATGRNDGSSWADAYTNLSYLQEVGCVRSNTIWVAGGTHYPTSGTDRAISFELRDNINWYGGFAGNESTLESRNWVANPTILSGNIGDTNTDADNSYHVLKLGGTKVLLDGFNIEGGNAQGGDLDITYQKQSGGGILLVAGEDTTELTLRNCIIRNNEALYGGGAIAHFGLMDFAPSSLKIYGSLFTNNKSAQGASIFHYAVSDNIQPRSLSTQLINCTISKNSSDMYGTGGIHYTALGNTLQSALKINNSIIWDNLSLYNTQIDALGSENNIALTNTAIANNRFAGSNILNADPQFDTGTFNLKSTSPCRNVGDNAAASLAGLTKDLGFNDRLLSMRVDLGAYEGLCLSNQTISLTFNNGALTVQDGGVLTSTSKVIPTSNTTFDAKNAVVLQPGFTAGGNGVVFTAQIGGCN